MPPKKKPIDFEQSLADLENLVARMEQGDMSLDDSLKAFAEGVALTRECQARLAEAELKVNQLISDEGHVKTVPFYDSSEDADQ